MRVFTGSLATETNTFAPMPTGLSAFRERGYSPAGQHPERMTQLRAAMPVDMVVLGLHGAMVAEGYDGKPGGAGSGRQEKADARGGIPPRTNAEGPPVDLVVCRLVAHEQQADGKHVRGEAERHREHRENHENRTGVGVEERHAASLCLSCPGDQQGVPRVGVPRGAAAGTTRRARKLP